LRKSGEVPVLVKEGYKLRDQAMARMGRVQLLVGGTSPTMKAGWDALRSYSVALSALEDADPFDEDAVGVATEHLGEAAILRPCRPCRSVAVGPASGASGDMRI
jgi:hypothetical protein